MKQLIFLDDIISIKSLSINTNVEKDLNPFILEAQDFDLRQFLGDPFYLALQNDFDENTKTFTDFDELWNGSEYQVSGMTIKHDGLKMILIYQAYARYILNSGSTATPSGFMKKTNQYSEAIDVKELSIKSNQAKAGATAYELRSTNYLDYKNSDFPLWRYSSKEIKYSAGKKIRKIKKI